MQMKYKFKYYLVIANSDQPHLQLYAIGTVYIITVDTVIITGKAPFQI
jgi:hypothetical protein